MSLQRVKSYLAQFGVAEQVIELAGSIATVELAATALEVAPARIAKTLSFRGEKPDSCFLVVMAGDARIDNAKFRAAYRHKAKMLTAQEVVTLIGHPVGGVCPFAIQPHIPVYLDISLKRFATVFPACGSAHSAIQLSCQQLARYSNAAGWVDVCRDWDPQLG